MDGKCGCKGDGKINSSKTSLLGSGQFRKKRVLRDDIKAALKKAGLEEAKKGEKVDIEIMDPYNPVMIEKAPQTHRRICLDHLKKKRPGFEIKKS